MKETQQEAGRWRIIVDVEEGAEEGVEEVEEVEGAKV